MPALVILLVLGPAQTISGKYYQQSKQYRTLHATPAVALPAPLPKDVDALCGLIEGGHATPMLFAALGDALLTRGDSDLAYRAFDKAQRLKHKDPKHIVARKDASGYVADKVIADEERVAKVWVDALDSYVANAAKAGQDPRDLAPFHERYGKPEDDLNALIRARRISFLGGILGFLVGAASAFAASRMSKRAAAVPLLVAGACFATPLMIGVRGLLLWGGGAAFVGGLVVTWRGK